MTDDTKLPTTPEGIRRELTRLPVHMLVDSTSSAAAKRLYQFNDIICNLLTQLEHTQKHLKLCEHHFDCLEIERNEARAAAEEWRERFFHACPALRPFGRIPEPDIFPWETPATEDAPGTEPEQEGGSQGPQQEGEG